jgi:hypothetical protein
MGHPCFCRIGQFVNNNDGGDGDDDTFSVKGTLQLDNDLVVLDFVDGVIMITSLENIGCSCIL